MSTPMIRQFTKTHTVDPWSDWKRERCEDLVIFPDKADDILENHNTHNRGFITSLANRLIVEVKEHWKFNGETIIFDWNGILMDGQHRLWACARTGIPIRSYVVFGRDPEDFWTIDKGRTRKTSDDLSAEKEKNSGELAAVLALLYLDDNKSLTFHVGLNSYDAFKTLDKYPQAREFTNLAKNSAKKCRLTPKIMGYSYLRFAEKDRSAADKFFHDLEVGADISATDAMLYLRRRLDRVKKKTTIDNMEMLALVIKTWNARRKNEKVKGLKWQTSKEKPEKFPTII